MLLGSRKITVLGAGIAGLAVATALARHGAEVVVLERADAIREVGAGLQVSPNGVAVLRALGLGNALAARSGRGSAVVLRDYRRGARVLRLDLSRGARDYFFVHRADLIDILADAARAAGVQIRLLHEVTGLSLEGDRAELITAQGARASSDLLIGADGLHSVVRAALNGQVTPRFAGQVAWRALVPARGKVPPVANVHMGPGKHLVHYPLRGGDMINIVAVEEREAWVEEGWNRTGDPDAMRRVFADFGGEVPRLLEQVHSVNLWGLFRHPVAESWYRGPAAILGDAAHPTLPFLAQGANMALEDAWVLAAALARHPTAEVAFAAYQAERRPRTARIVEMASKNARNYHLSFPPLRLAAQTALRLGGILAPGAALRRFDWLYGYDAAARYPLPAAAV
ncbi:monooxygenase [Rhodovulum sp. BSW8]|uniref:Salicylate hydroxylase n=1 Tax=Rhodovulum visakhapatnamense TaxID=364297 RepID=A0A4R8G076_9RHOB|nr:MULTISPECIES: FAD-dependent monooxygenase [Rhodovulum]RBO52785.1 monooxygenase [Rhodovulum sp. BSW8]TDX32466.1 salicylate hydroxylase [Rhodovulum visakhapatnamense]